MAYPAKTLEQRVLEVEAEWCDAVVRADTEAIDCIVSEDFMATNPFGETRHREEFIANIRDGSPAYDFINREGPAVRIYGNVAVATGRATLKGTYKEMDVTGPYRYTAVYVEREGRVQPVAIHFSRDMWC
jgi:ketosteroid isomerase-like protein